MTEQELNKKRAEWAGFTFRPFAPQYATPGEPDPEYVYSPDGESCDLPDFLQSLDACLKWLSPLVDFYQMNNWNKKKKPIVFLFHNDKTFQGEGQTLALAWCSANDKLIDGRE